jgi:hypothetical protein
MTLRERIIPCSDFPDWKHDLELTGYHVIDSTPNPGRPGMCTLRFEADFDTADSRALSFAAPLAAAAPTALRTPSSTYLKPGWCWADTARSPCCPATTAISALGDPS